MKKYNLLGSYSNSKIKRIANENTRTINERIIASYRDKNLFDGERRFGYGGFKYDGRWKDLAKRIVGEYKLNDKSRLSYKLEVKKDFY